MIRLTPVAIALSVGVRADAVGLRFELVAGAGAGKYSPTFAAGMVGSSRVGVNGIRRNRENEPISSSQEKPLFPHVCHHRCKVDREIFPTPGGKGGGLYSVRQLAAKISAWFDGRKAYHAHFQSGWPPTCIGYSKLPQHLGICPRQIPSQIALQRGKIDVRPQGVCASLGFIGCALSENGGCGGGCKSEEANNQSKNGRSGLPFRDIKRLCSGVRRPGLLYKIIGL